MKAVAVVNLTDDPRVAAESVAAQALDALGDSCSLAILTVSTQWHDQIREIATTIARALGPDVMIGGCAQGVIADADEYQTGPVIGLWAASMPTGRVELLRAALLPRQDRTHALVGWPDTSVADVTLLLADPYTFPIPDVARRLAKDRPGHRLLGGLVTGGPKRTALVGYLDGGQVEVYPDGAIGVVLRDLEVSTVVSQGCRPVGRAFTITAAQGNVISELAGMPATEQLRQLFEDADPADRLRMQHGLHIGFIAHESGSEYREDDYIIRPVLGADDATGRVSVAQLCTVGQTVQFHVRDPLTALDDLRQRLESVTAPTQTALLFTCTGRGERFFGLPSQDAGLVASLVNGPIAGAFCAGEIGPVGSANFLHAQSATMLLFHEQAVEA